MLGLAETVKLEGAVAESEAGQEKLLRLGNVTVEAAEDPGVIVRLGGLDVMEKSDTEGPITDTEVIRELMSLP